jgi:pyruvate/2-oxoglutarate dehydrogenase complex dihydrolipoamide dehydrogenase (E3) component
VPGVYVAGDVSRDVLLVAAAIAEGAKAAVAITKLSCYVTGSASEAHRRPSRK